MTHGAPRHQWEESGAIDSSRLLFCVQCPVTWRPGIEDPPSAVCTFVEVPA